MSLAVQDPPPLVRGTGHGGMPARRAVLRWAWRLFRREWRQQSIVLALMLVAVAATTIGLGIAANAPSEAAVFGTADHVATLTSAGPQLGADLAELRSGFGAIEVIEHGKQIPVPGTANGIDLRAQDPHGTFGRTMLRLDAGRWPQGPGEVAVTDRVLKIFGLQVGDTWDQGGVRRTVAGQVENPLDLNDEFVLLAPGQLGTPDHVDVLLQASPEKFIATPRPGAMSTQARANDANAANVMVLVLASIGLVFVGLMAVAGFTVMAQRRLRALGMLGAIGASHRLIRLVLLANGALIGAAGAVTGAVVGVLGWALLSPRLEQALGHRIDRFQLPWMPLLIAVGLAIVTAVVAAWWPARAAARLPVIAALSARPPRPRPAHRFAAIGVMLLAGGLAALYYSQHEKPALVIGGVLATAIALLLLAPAGIATMGGLVRHAPLAPRLAIRDLARYRARSGAALAAIALAVGIAAVVAVSTAVSAAKSASPSGGNLPADQIVVWVSQEKMSGPVPELTTAQLSAARSQVDGMAAQLHATSVLPLTGAVDPNAPVERDTGGRPPYMVGKPHPLGGGATVYSDQDSYGLFVATPELLAHYGIDPADIDAGAEVVTSLESLDGFDLFPGKDTNWHPTPRHASLPDYSSLPKVLLTTYGMNALHATPILVGWLIQAPQTLTQTQLDKASQAAVAGGLNLESRPTGVDQARLAAQFTAGGIAVALGVLAMTVGLIRSETARDLRTLTAAGARRRTRRALAASTAGALALCGAIIGTTCAYLALLAWNLDEIRWLAHPPLLNLAALLVGLPIVAYLGGWLFAGREASMIARQPMD